VLVISRKSRLRKVTVELHDERSGADMFDPDGGPWITYCRQHDTICNFTTRRSAEYHLPVVDWCECCTGICQDPKYGYHDAEHKYEQKLW
jgi:hypothetical protein